MISVSQVGQILALEDLIELFLVGAEYHLFVNNVTIDYETDLGEFVEASFPGYAPQAVGTWSDPVNVDNYALTEADDLVFTASGLVDPTQSVYGYYVLNGDGEYIYGENIGTGPWVFANTGDTGTITPRFAAIAVL